MASGTSIFNPNMVAPNPNNWIPLGYANDPCWINDAACESPLELGFAYQLRKTELGLYGVFVQVPIARYRVDFLIEHEGRKIVVELDGKAYHDKERDYRRDKEIINYVDAIIRIPFSSMTYYENATMVAISKWEPRLAVPEEISTVPYREARKQRGSTDWMQVYHLSDRHALVGSFEQIDHQQKISVITLQRRENSKRGKRT